MIQTLGGHRWVSPFSTNAYSCLNFSKCRVRLQGSLHLARGWLEIFWASVSPHSSKRDFYYFQLPSRIWLLDMMYGLYLFSFYILTSNDETKSLDFSFSFIICFGLGLFFDSNCSISYNMRTKWLLLFLSGFDKPC